MPLLDRSLRRRIHLKLAQLATLRPFPLDLVRQLDELVTVSMTYHSNALEGSTLQLVAAQVDASLTLYLSSFVADDHYREISLEAAAGHVGIRARRLRTLAAAGKLEARRRGKRWVTWPGALAAYRRTRNPVGKPRQAEPEPEGAPR